MHGKRLAARSRVRLSTMKLCLVTACLALASPARAQSLTPWATPAAAALDLEILTGGTASLAAHRDDVVIVHFFATWCEPCEEELHELNRLAQTHPGLTILAVDVGEPRSRVERFFKASPVAFAVLLDPAKTAMKAWGVDVLPTTFMLKRGLCPAFKSDGVVAWTAAPTLDALQSALTSSRQSPVQCLKLGASP